MLELYYLLKGVKENALEMLMLDLDLGHCMSLEYVK